MANKYLKAVLIGSNTIEVTVNLKYPFAERKKFSLSLDGVTIESLNCLSLTKNKDEVVYTLTSLHPFTVDNVYKIKDDTNELFPLDVSYLATLDNFYDKYKYDGPLGAIYTKEETSFYVFSPLAKRITLELTPKNGKTILVEMTKDKENGIFKTSVKGDHEEAKYIYLVEMMGRIFEVCDPYAVSLTTNSLQAYIVDINKVKDIPSYRDNLPKLEHYSDRIIYELDVRDMTSLTNLTDRGTYNALAREGEKDSQGTKIGMDYIKELGVNTVQLLPVYDFQTIDDSRPFDSYNWGYDPKFYFAPEGSYSSDPNSPYARLIELKKLVSTFHKNGIRVIMDVVYNHVYSRLTNSLDLLCPNYYFRKNNDGTYSNGSFCGNDFDSTKYMAHRIIKESLELFMNVYGMDGFRFDLMGIIDKDTLIDCYHSLKEQNPDVMFYGEGWDMPTNLPSNFKSSINNAFALEGIGFFNDRFRDISKGKTSEDSLGNKGYLTGDLNYIDGFKHIYLGSSVAISYPPMFISPNQSINYAECHDNSTLFDKLAICCGEENLEERFKRLKLVNTCVMFSHGIPFFHMGQEIGLSKNGNCNSYNSSDEENGMKYDVVYERKNLVSYFKDLCEFRKTCKIFKIVDNQEMISTISFHNINCGALLIKYTYENEEFYVIYNPSKESFSYNFDKYVRVLFNENGKMKSDYEFFSQVYIVNALSVSVLHYKK